MTLTEEEKRKIEEEEKFRAEARVRAESKTAKNLNRVLLDAWESFY